MSTAEEVIQGAITAYCDYLFKLPDPRTASLSLPAEIVGALRDAGMLNE